MQVYASFSEEEKGKIKALMELGFSREDSVTAYIAGKKDMNLAANLLVSHGRPLGPPSK
jgi:hypothetical protein